ncbi:hypothetical protein ABG067_006975 [Albugo candida]
MRFVDVIVWYVSCFGMIGVRSGDSTAKTAPTDGCCATCIGKTSNVPYTYDPVIHKECSAAKGVCCYNCAKEGDSEPDVLNAKFGNGGTTPQIVDGNWIQLKWSGIDRVTYEYYTKGHKKVTTVRNSSSEATKKASYFFICASRGAGKFVLRGWGPDACLLTTPEFTIEITSAGANGGAAKCSENSDGALSDLLNTESQKGSQTCNLQRASWKVGKDGSKECVCTSDWSGPPSCSGFPWWKTAATVGGALAALFSIAASVKVFLTNRKNKKQAAAKFDDDDTVFSPATSSFDSRKERISLPKASKQEYTL